METDSLPPEDQPIVFDEEKAERLSRFLALVLRHRAPSFSLEMDDEGFVFVDDLLDVIDERQSSLSWVEFEHIEALTKSEGRQRFEIQDDRVRATYGHSFPRPIRYETATPPDNLYIGLAKGKLPDLKSKGLLPVGRQYVHLSEQYDDALEVGRHQGEDATVVTVKAADAARDGVRFFRPTKGIYLVSKLSPDYLELKPEYGRRPRKGRRR